MSVIMLYQCTHAKNIVELEVTNSNSALMFSEKWLCTPTLYIGLILPTETTFRLNAIVSLVKRMVKNYKDRTYFLATNNITRYKSMKSLQNDLLWLPFEFKHYHLDCQVLNNTKHKKHFLLFTGRERNVNDYFQCCEIHFNSEIVVYYRHNQTKFLSGVRFEEIYKIKPQQRKLNKNILGEDSQHFSGINIHGLKTFIWKRRSNLHGVNFNAIAELSKPVVVNFTTSKMANQSNVVTPLGYFPDIMGHLISTLNFSIATILTPKRYSWTYLVKMVGKGNYDIGYQGFVQTTLRTELVDFSYGITPTSFKLFYVKQATNFRFDVFLRSFHGGTWNILALCVITLISGYIIIVSMVVGRRSELSILRKLISNFKTATNFVLRLFIAKRINTEPTWISSRLAFWVLVFSGFFILSLYRAILVAFVAVEIDTPPVKSLNDLMTSNYRLAVRKYTLSEDIFLNAIPGTTEYEIQNSNKIIRFSEAVDMYVDKMVNNINGASSTMLWYTDSVVQFSEHYPCSLLPIETRHQGNKQILGMIFKKNWQYTHLFNYYLLVMKEKGLMDKLFQPYLTTTKKSCPDDQLIRHLISKPKPVGINTTVSGYLIIFVGIICALFVLFLEVLYS